MPRIPFPAITLLLACLAATPARADRLLLATFNNSEQKLRVMDSTNATSFDGYDRGIAYSPPPGNNLRDPSIIYHQGRYFICHTTGDFGAAAHFSIIVSDDLRNWSQLTDVPMTGIAGVQRTWAPEWFRDGDGSLHIFVSATTNAVDMSDKHIIYSLTALDTNNLTSWSAPTPVTGPAFGWTGNEGRRVGAYDPYVVKRGSTYYMFYFNQYTDYIELTSSPALTGPYSRIGTNNWQGIGLYKEGPSVAYLGGGRWRMFFADQLYSFLSYIDSTNNWQTWTTPQQVSLPGAPTNFTVNHGTVIIPPGGLELGTTLTAQSSSAFNLEFRATAGDSYRLWSSTNLVSWNPAALIGPTTNGPASQQIETGAATKQFWRLERLIPE